MERSDAPIEERAKRCQLLGNLLVGLAILAQGIWMVSYLSEAPSSLHARFIDQNFADWNAPFFESITV